MKKTRIANSWQNKTDADACAVFLCSIGLYVLNILMIPFFLLFEPSWLKVCDAQMLCAMRKCKEADAQNYFALEEFVQTTSIILCISHTI
jgi:hypothetical protein